MKTRKQMKVLAGLLGVYALLVASSYLFFYDQITAGVPGAAEQPLPASLWQVALVAAAGVHFWADVVWHVAWPLFVA